MSTPNPSSDFQFDNILAPTPAPTHSRESDAEASASIYDWELPQLSETITTDGTILGDESELTRQCIIDTWLSQLGAGAIEPIPNHSPLYPPIESHNLAGSMTINAPGASAGASSDCSTPVATPLHTAAKRGHTKIVRLLLEHKAQCDIRDHEGLTPLIYATMGGHEEVVGLLLSHGASVGLTDQQNRSALHWAVMNRFDRLLKVLLGNCIEDKSVIDGLTIEGRTPLHIAVETDF